MSSLKDDDYYTSDSEDERYLSRPAKKARTPAEGGPTMATRGASTPSAPRSVPKPPVSAAKTSASATMIDYSDFTPLSFDEGEEVPVDMLRVYILPVVLTGGEKDESAPTSTRKKDMDHDVAQAQAISDPHSANNLQAHSLSLFHEQVIYFAKRPQTLKVMVDEADRSIAKNFEIMMNILLKMVEVFDKYRVDDVQYERDYGDFIHRILENNLHHLLLAKGIRFNEKWISKTYIDKCYKMFLWLISSSSIAFQELVKEAPIRDYQLTDTMLYMLEHHSQATSSKSFNRQIVSLLIKIFHYVLIEADLRDPMVLDPYRIAGAIASYRDKFQTRVDHDVVVKMDDMIRLLGY